MLRLNIKIHQSRECDKGLDTWVSGTETEYRNRPTKICQAEFLKQCKRN